VGPVEDIELKGPEEVAAMKVILLIVALLCLVGTASATDYYVSTTGDNSNDGLSIPEAKYNFSDEDWFNSSTVKPGDTFYVIDGTWYNETIWLTNLYGVTNLIGNSTHHTKIVAYNGTPTFIELTGEDFTYGVFAYPSDSGASLQNFNISGLTFSNHSSPPIYVRRGTNLVFDNITLEQIIGSSLILVDVNNSVIKDSDFNGSGKGVAQANTLGIQANYRIVHNITIRNNKIHDNQNHNLIDLFSWSNTTNYYVKDIYINNNELYDSSYQALYPHVGGTGSNQNLTGIEYRNNTIHEVNLGIKVDYLKDCIINDNTFYNCSSYGISTTGTAFYLADNVSMVNNTAYDMTTPEGTVFISSTGTQYLNESNMSYFTARLGGNIIVLDNIVQNYTIKTDGNPSGYALAKNTSNNIMSENGINQTYYYPTYSGMRTNESETVEIVTYNITYTPNTGYGKDVVVNTNLIDDISNITGNVSEAATVTITFMVENASDTYNFYVDDVWNTSAFSNSDSIVSFNYVFASATPTNFEVTWNSTEGWSPETNHIYYQRSFTVDSNGNITQLGTPEQGDQDLTALTQVKVS